MKTDFFTYILAFQYISRDSDECHESCRELSWKRVHKSTKAPGKNRRAKPLQVVLLTRVLLLEASGYDVLSTNHKQKHQFSTAELEVQLSMGVSNVT